MSWLKKFPWLSLTLLLLTYSLFGWWLSESNTSLTMWLIEKGRGFGWLLEEEIVSGIIHLLAVALIALISIALTAPITLMTIFFQSSLESDRKAFFSVFVWAFVFVLIICLINYFVRLLVMLAAAILARLELQTAGYNEWQAFAIIVIVCLTGFGFGLLTFTLWGEAAL
ncbi:MAG: hypothetical protein AB4426_01580 [Xenococcaceae cyanobacterium]